MAFEDLMNVMVNGRKEFQARLESDEKPEVRERRTWRDFGWTVGSVGHPTAYNQTNLPVEVRIKDKVYPVVDMTESTITVVYLGPLTLKQIAESKDYEVLNILGEVVAIDLVEKAKGPRRLKEGGFGDVAVDELVSWMDDYQGDPPQTELRKVLKKLVDKYGSAQNLLKYLKKSDVSWQPGDLDKIAAALGEGKIPAKPAETDQEKMKKALMEQKPDEKMPADADVPSEEPASKADELEPEPPAPHDKDEETPEKAEPEVPELTKELLGKTEDTTYYIVADRDDAGNLVDVIVQDQEEAKKFSAKEFAIDPNDIPMVIVEAVRELKIEDISSDIFMRYIYPLLVEEEKEEGEEAEEVLPDGTEAAEKPQESTVVPATGAPIVHNESKVREAEEGRVIISVPDSFWDDLMAKLGWETYSAGAGSVEYRSTQSYVQTRQTLEDALADQVPELVGELPEEEQESRQTAEGKIVDFNGFKFTAKITEKTNAGMTLCVNGQTFSVPTELAKLFVVDGKLDEARLVTAVLKDVKEHESDRYESMMDWTVPESEMSEEASEEEVVVPGDVFIDNRSGEKCTVVKIERSGPEPMVVIKSDEGSPEKRVPGLEFVELYTRFNAESEVGEEPGVGEASAPRDSAEDELGIEESHGYIVTFSDGKTVTIAEAKSRVDAMRQAMKKNKTIPNKIEEHVDAEVSPDEVTVENDHYIVRASGEKMTITCKGDAGSGPGREEAEGPKGAPAETPEEQEAEQATGAEQHYPKEKGSLPPKEKKLPFESRVIEQIESSPPFPFDVQHSLRFQDTFVLEMDELISILGEPTRIHTERPKDQPFGFPGSIRGPEWFITFDGQPVQIVGSADQGELGIAFVLTKDVKTAKSFRDYVELELSYQDKPTPTETRKVESKTNEAVDIARWKSMVKILEDWRDHCTVDPSAKKSFQDGIASLKKTIEKYEKEHAEKPKGPVGEARTNRMTSKHIKGSEKKGK